MERRKLRVGMIGFGFRAQGIIRVLSELEQMYDVVAVSDLKQR